MLNTIWMTTRWALVPTVISIIITSALTPDFRWDNVPFHVIVEGGGALIGFGLAFVILAMIKKNQLTASYIWLVACFVSMGSLDIVHSQLSTGQTFVWLHSVATFVGGLFAMLIWLPSAVSKKFHSASYFWLIIILIIAFSIATLYWPEAVPVMLSNDKEFTWVAKILNIAGGAGFLSAWFYSAREYHQFHNPQSFYFSNHFCLFALAAALFESSALWDGSWWFWHMMRAFAYIYLMFHFAVVYRGEIEKSKQILEQSLEKSEERYRRLIETSPDWIWEIDNKGVYTYSSPKLYDFLGYSSDEVLGMTPFELMHADVAERSKNIFQTYLESKSLIQNMESVYLHKNGHSVTFETNAVPILNEEGDLLGYHGINYDITERKKAEGEKARMQRELQQAQKMESLGQLTGGIAHDFNNLLGIISGFTGLVMEKCLAQGDKKLTGYMVNIEEASKRAIDLVTQMLAFSRVDQGEDILTQCGPLIKEDIKMLRATLPSSIDIQLDIEPDLPDIKINPIQLHQILMNLIINSRDAMQGAGEIKVKLGWARNVNTESPVSHKPVCGDWIEMSVRDTGSGIDPEIVNNIFDPFFTTKEVGKGTGMGLAVVYGIVDNHNGHILFESVHGKGTIFRLLFAPVQREKQIIKLTESGAELPDGNGLEVLIVDDEPGLGIFMAEIVKNQGYKETLVVDSIEALKLFSRDPGRFSILITDQTMPGMTGVELIDKLHEIRPDLPVILCSGYSEQINSMAVSKRNFHFLSKPVDKNELLLKISELIK